MARYKKNKNIIVVSIVMLVNALSYGTIIPLMYPYATRFGINPTGMSFLFAGYSLAQFIATPVIGRLSDKYGRKPLLLLSLFGTSLSLGLFASATTAWMLFVARILDGITGGNISVAQAIIADTTTKKERARGFGILGAVFGFGFVFGPAIGGLLSTKSISTPFWFGSLLALIGTLLGLLVLKETKGKEGESKTRLSKLFDFNSLKNALFEPLTGVILITSFLTLIGNNAMIIGFQAYTVDILNLNTKQIGIIFMLFGIVNVLMQGFGIKLLMEKTSSKRMLVKISIVLSAILIIGVSVSSGYYLFVALLIAFGAAFAPIAPIVTSLISERTKAEDQGGILGINQAYTSLAQVIGPLLAGVIVTLSVNLVFVFVGLVLFLSLIPTSRITDVPRRKLNL